MKRLPILLCFLIALTGPACATEPAPSGAKQYLPYPDVWHRVIPSGQWAYFQTAQGDLFIEYEVTSAAPKFRANGMLFFSGKELKNSAEHRNSYGSVFKKLMYQLPIGSSRPAITLGQITRQLHPLCPQALNYFFEVKYPDGRAEKLSLLYMLDKPLERKVRPGCNSSERSYIEKIVALAPVFYPLADQTFLALDEKYGFVIRFDEKLGTRSKLMNEKLFWVDADLLGQSWRDGETSYQRMQDQILKYLQETKK